MMTLKDARRAAAQLAEAQAMKQLIVEAAASPSDYFVWPGRVALDARRWRIVEVIRPEEAKR